MPNDVVALGKALHPTCLGGMSLYLLQSLWIRASAKWLNVNVNHYMWTSFYVQVCHQAETRPFSTWETQPHQCSCGWKESIVGKLSQKSWGVTRWIWPTVALDCLDADFPSKLEKTVVLPPGPHCIGVPTEKKPSFLSCNPRLFVWVLGTQKNTRVIPSMYSQLQCLSQQLEDE